jgi:hypothetical protein
VVAKGFVERMKNCRTMKMMMGDLDAEVEVVVDVLARKLKRVFVYCNVGEGCM